ncbi:hypothetical protein CSB20_05725, partial [bacterium DOLZORAL124_64_63]
CDKLILTVLQECIDTYLETRSRRDSCGVPALDFIAEDVAALKARAEKIIHSLPEQLRGYCEIVDSTARTGGGTMPKSEIPSVAVAISPKSISVAKLARRLRTGTPAVVGTAVDNKLQLDLRTVFTRQDEELATALGETLVA